MVSVLRRYLPIMAGSHRSRGDSDHHRGGRSPSLIATQGELSNFSSHRLSTTNPQIFSAVSSRVQVQMATVEGRPMTLAARAITWSISSGVTPASFAFRTLE